MGPLHGVRIIEIAGLGAAPYGCMMLADMGAEVVRIERPASSAEAPSNSPLLRNRRSIAVDLKTAVGLETVLALSEKADVFVEAFRPGVAERLRIGPEVCHARNPKLNYARMTGWGQTGPLAQAAGHDLNYIGLTGLLHQIGPIDGKPVVPLNVIGDFGGGGLLMAYGIVCALFETRNSGQGQIIDAAMIDGALSFMAMSFGSRAQGQFDDRTGAHLLGGGAHYYDVYETRDGKHLSVAPIEPQFYRSFVERLGVDPERFLPAGFPRVTQAIRTQDWPALKAELTAIFKRQTRDDWVERFAGADACVFPVLTLAEAAVHPHNQSRQMFITVDGVEQNAPAPRFSRTRPAPPRFNAPGTDSAAKVMSDWNIDADRIAKIAR